MSLDTSEWAPFKPRGKETAMNREREYSLLLHCSDRPVAEASIYTTENKHKRQTSTRPEGFEYAIPAFELPQTYALDCTATGIGCCKFKDM